jgi:6,7-dimethyl-8-ribityllumazine synthase
VKIALIVADFNGEVTSKMERRALEHADSLKLEVASVIHVPGVYDMPLVIDRLLLRADIDGVVLIGAVIKGETKHDEVITHAVAQAAAEISVKHGKPVGLGVTGPGMTDEQAEERVGNAANAVEAVARIHRLLSEID